MQESPKPRKRATKPKQAAKKEPRKKQALKSLPAQEPIVTEEAPTRLAGVTPEGTFMLTMADNPDVKIPVHTASECAEIDVPKHPVGAPNKRTPERRAAILDCLQLGMSKEAAAKFAGISYDCLNDWQQADSDFYQAIEKARNHMEYEMLDRIREAANDPKNWQAAAWKLERIIPDKYARKFQAMAMAQEQPPGDAPGKVYRVSIAPAEENA